MTQPLLIVGAPGSPYTRKMLSVLRYRRIPYRFRITSIRKPPADLPQPKVWLLPTLYFEGAEGGLDPVVDSTPIIRRLEREYPGREIVPTDPVIRFLDELIEDYGDEWLTKAMFHYRWHYAADVHKGGEILPRWSGIDVPEAEVEPIKQAIRDRQVNRLYVVGSNDTTAPVIEASYERFLKLMDAHLTGQPYVLGHRPSSCDFGLFGQLTQLAKFDPTPAEVTMRISPRVYAWTEVMEDLSGLEPGPWIDAGNVPATLTAFLAEMGRTYVPVMLANAKAINDGAKKVELTVDGKPWVQQPFPYQAKCVSALRNSYASLDDQDRGRLDAVFAGTGLEALFA